MNKDLFHSFATCIMREAQATTADVASAWVDTKGFESLAVLVSIGALTGVDGSNTILPVLQESDSTTAASATAVSSANILGAFTLVNSTALDSVVQKVGYIGSKRYVRVLFDITGTGISAGIMGATALLSDARVSPPSDVAPTAAT